MALLNVILLFVRVRQKLDVDFCSLFRMSYVRDCGLGQEIFLTHEIVSGLQFAVIIYHTTGRSSWIQFADTLLRPA